MKIDILLKNKFILRQSYMGSYSNFIDMILHLLMSQLKLNLVAW